MGSEAKVVRVFVTASYCVAFIGLGLEMSVIGPTIPGMSEAIGLSAPTDLAPILVARGAGYGIGTFAMGLLVDRHPAQAHRLWAVSTAFFALFCALVPVCCAYGGGPVASVVFVAAVVGLLSVFGGAIDVVGNVLIVWLWDGDDKGAGPAMNMLHAAWSVGSSLSPIVAGAIGLGGDSVAKVYLCCTAVTLSTGFIPLSYSPPRPPPASATEELVASNADGVGFPKQRFCRGIAAMFLFYFCYAGAEHLPGDWTTTVVADENGRIRGSHTDGAHATAAFWGALLAGRLLSVPAAWFLSSTQLLNGEFALAVAGCIFFVAFGLSRFDAMIVSLVAIGLGLAALYPSGILLAKQRLPLNATWISRFIVGGLVGSMLVPAAVGFVLEAHPSALGWAEMVMVVSQTLCYYSVAVMPRREAAGSAATIENGSGDGGDVQLTTKRKTTAANV